MNLNGLGIIELLVILCRFCCLAADRPGARV